MTTNRAKTQTSQKYNTNNDQKHSGPVFADHKHSRLTPINETQSTSAGKTAPALTSTQTLDPKGVKPQIPPTSSSKDTSFQYNLAVINQPVPPALKNMHDSVSHYLSILDRENLAHYIKSELQSSVKYKKDKGQLGFDLVSLLSNIKQSTNSHQNSSDIEKIILQLKSIQKRLDDMTSEAKKNGQKNPSEGKLGLLINNPKSTPKNERYDLQTVIHQLEQFSAILKKREKLLAKLKMKTPAAAFEVVSAYDIAQPRKEKIKKKRHSSDAQIAKALKGQPDDNKSVIHIGQIYVTINLGNTTTAAPVQAAAPVLQGHAALPQAARDESKSAPQQANSFVPTAPRAPAAPKAPKSENNDPLNKPQGWDLIIQELKKRHLANALLKANENQDQNNDATASVDSKPSPFSPAKH